MKSWKKNLWDDEKAENLDKDSGHFQKRPHINQNIWIFFSGLECTMVQVLYHNKRNPRLRQCARVCVREKERKPHTSLQTIYISLRCYYIWMALGHGRRWSRKKYLFKMMMGHDRFYEMKERTGKEILDGRKSFHMCASEINIKISFFSSPGIKWL